MKNNILLEPRYVINDVTALTAFTAEQRKVIIEYSNAFEVFGLTAFTQMAEIFHDLDIDIKSLPPEVFVAFPNKYQSLGRKLLLQFDQESYQHFCGYHSLQWFLSTSEEEQKIRFFLSTNDWKLNILFSFQTLLEKEFVLENIYQLFLSGNVAHCYLFDILSAFENEILEIKFFPKNGEVLYVSEKDIIFHHFVGSPIYFRLDLADTYVFCDDTRFFQTEPVFHFFESDLPSTYLEDIFQNTMLKSPLDLAIILNKMGFSAPFDLDILEDNKLSLLDYDDHEFTISFFSNSMFIQLEGDDFAYEYAISTPGVSIGLELQNIEVYDL